MTLRNRRTAPMRKTAAGLLSGQEYVLRARAREDGYKLTDAFCEAMKMIPPRRIDHDRWHDSLDRSACALRDMTIEAVRTYPEYRRYWMTTQLLGGFISRLIAQDCEGFSKLTSDPTDETQQQQPRSLF